MKYKKIIWSAAVVSITSAFSSAAYSADVRYLSRNCGWFQTKESITYDKEDGSRQDFATLSIQKKDNGATRGLFIGEPFSRWFFPAYSEGKLSPQYANRIWFNQEKVYAGYTKNQARYDEWNYGTVEGVHYWLRGNQVQVRRSPTWKCFGWQFGYGFYGKNW